LAATYGIVKQLSGDMKVESAVGLHSRHADAHSG